MSELKVNTISEVTGANGVVIDSVKLKDGEVYATKIQYTDGDDAITIADGGGITVAQAATFSSTIDSGAITSTGIVTGTAFTAGSAVLAEAELELLDGLTAGTAIASKVVTTDANIDTTGQRNLTISGELDAATLDISGAIDVAGTTNLDVVDIDGAVDMASTLQVDGVATFTAVPVFPNNTIETADIQADAITAAKIADNAISEEHLDVTAITGHTAETSVADGDLVVVHDASASALRKMTVANLIANAGGGKILQVVSATKTDTHAESVNQNTFFSNNVASLEPQITCSATSSKVLVIVSIAAGMSATGAISMGVFRGSTQIDLGESSSNRGRTSKGMIFNGEAQYMANIMSNFLDAPNSTSQLTYGIKLGHTSGSSKTVYVNRDHSYTDAAFRYPTSTSTITLMEIGA